MIPLIPGRECGPCTVCCVAPTIDQPDIQKEAGARCRHCTHGCAIYETRPQVCRNFHCGWRQLGIFGDEWRSDKSGVLVELEAEDKSGPLALASVSLSLIDNPLKTLRQPWFIDFVVTAVTQNMPLDLVLPGPRGYRGAKQRLNTYEMRDAAVAGSRTRVKELLEKVLKELIAHHCRPHVMTNSGNDVSS